MTVLGVDGSGDAVPGAAAVAGTCTLRLPAVACMGTSFLISASLLNGSAHRPPDAAQRHGSKDNLTLPSIMARRISAMMVSRSGIEGALKTNLSTRR